MKPTINEYELEQVAEVLSVTNPGRASAASIRTCVAVNWPFDNIAIGGWVAYAEAPGRNNNVRIALTPCSVGLYLLDTGVLLGASPTEGMDQ